MTDRDQANKNKHPQDINQQKGQQPGNKGFQQQPGKPQSGQQAGQRPQQGMPGRKPDENQGQRAQRQPGRTGGDVTDEGESGHGRGDTGNRGAP